MLDPDVAKGGGSAGWIGLAARGFAMPSAENVVPVVKTPSTAFHYSYPYTTEIPQGTGIWGIPNLDGRNDGGYVIAPPTPGYLWLMRYMTRADIVAGTRDEL